MRHHDTNPTTNPSKTMNNQFGNALDTVILTATSEEAHHMDQPLTAMELPYVLPQHVNHTPYKKRTDKYDLFESDTIIENLQRMDFVVRDAITQKSHGKAAQKMEEKCEQNQTRHLYRLCRREDFGKPELPELVVVNSHNGACSLRVYTGYFRLICENGMIAGGKEELRIRHMGHTMQEVLEQIRGVAENFQNAYGKVDAFKTKFLSDGDIRDFARKANEIRVNIGLRPVGDPLALVAPRRYEDSGNDLWSVFNRTQENMMKGGLALAYDGTEKRKRLTRPIRNIVQNIDANRALWQMAEDFALNA